MTNGSFSESVTKEIVLPEDNADSFGRIVEHLYGNNDAAFDVDLLNFDGAENLADSYGLAEKYQLPSFQGRVVQKLQQLDVLRENPMAFFRIARQICQNTRETDDIFKSYFVKQAAIHLKSMSEQEVQELSDMIYLGGSFARKIFQVQTDNNNITRWNWLTDKVSLEKRIATAEKQLQSATTTAAADLKKAKRMHTSQHSACRKSLILWGICFCCCLAWLWWEKWRRCQTSSTPRFSEFNML